MDQLNFFDYLKSVPKKTEQLKKNAVSKVHKVLSKSTPDLIIDLSGKGFFTLTGTIGLTKLDMLNMGSNHLFNFSLTDYIREEKRCVQSFNELDRSVVSYTFSPDAQKTIKRLKKLFMKKTIPIRVDVEKEEIIV